MVELLANPKGWLSRQTAAQKRINNKGGDDRAAVRNQRKEHLAGRITGSDYIREFEPKESKPSKDKKLKDLSRDELISILVISGVEFSVDLSDQTLRRKLRRHLDAPA